MNEDEKESRRIFSRELENRTLRFAVMIIRLSAKLPNTPEGRVCPQPDCKVWNICRGKLQGGKQVS